MAKPAAAADVGGLFRIPPSGFVQARDALARRLREAGREPEATAVARLRRPTTALWAVNQLAVEDPGAVRAFLEASERLRQAAGDRAALPDALRRRRESFRALMQGLERVLASAGVAAAPEALRRASATLAGAAVDPEARAQLEQGRLTRERAAPGFELLEPMSGGTPPGGKGRQRRATAAASPAGPGAPASPQARAAAAALRAARARAREATRRAAELERQAAHHGRRAARLERDAGRARARLDRLERELTTERAAGERLLLEARRWRAEARQAGPSSAGRPPVAPASDPQPPAPS